MLNLIDFLVIGLFITIVISIYKILKPENIEITNVVSGASLNKKALKSLIKSKDKKFANLIIETLSKIHGLLQRIIVKRIQHGF